MPTLYIETIPCGWNKFQLIQSGRIIESPKGGYDKDDWIEIREAEDRMYAAIINFGLAARYLVDEFKEWAGNEIIIVTDTDGNDTKFGGEHNVLYSFFNPYDDWEARKLAGLYQKYKPFLVRAKELVAIGRIRSKLQ